MLGDVHLGRPGAPLACSLGAGVLARHIDQLLDTHDVVVINGDLFDLERGSIPLAHSREYQRLAITHAAIVQRLSDPRVLLIAGNHDAVLVDELGALESVRVRTDVGDIHMEHGHRFDGPVKQWREFASVVTWASGRAAAAGAAPLVDVMRAIDRRLTGEQRAEGPIERGALRWLAHQQNVALMCIGHTHRSGIWRTSGRTLANPGDCVHGAIRHLSIDAKRAEVSRVVDGCVDGISTQFGIR